MVINIANDCSKNKYYVVDILVQVYDIYEYYLFKQILFIYNFQICTLFPKMFRITYRIVFIKISCFPNTFVSFLWKLGKFGST